MVEITETLAKYLAGLCDADGSLSLKFLPSKVQAGYRMQLILSVTGAESIDREGRFIRSLPVLTGCGSVHSRQRQHWARVNVWQVQKRADHNRILPRVIRHMVIKGKHWKRLFDLYAESKGKTLDAHEAHRLRALSVESRKDTGPLKPKKHPTWAWAAGYLEGDGCFVFKKHPSGYGRKLQVSATAHQGDAIALELLQKAFGGFVYQRGHDNCAEWRRNLGIRDKDFATKFLSKLVRHMKFKTHKAEQMLAYLYNHADLQRLSDQGSTEQAIV